VLAPLDGGQVRPIAKLAFREDVSQWSADGRTVFTAHGGNRLDIFAVDVQSGERKLWRTFEVPDPAGVRMMSFFMTRDGSSYAYGYLRVLDELCLVKGLE